MATTTNYGWTTPDDTALVKDGASAIRTLGSSVDTTTKNLNPETTLGDLSFRSSTSNVNTRIPIGSSGQHLTVVAGVPAWATASDQTPLTTKGDLFTFSTVDARLGVGANGTTLVADSAEATGLKWATPASGSGPAFRAFKTSGAGNQTIASSGTATKISFQGEDFDTDSCFDSTTNFRFTPTTAGKYLIGANLAIIANPANFFRMDIFKNGSEQSTLFFGTVTSTTTGVAGSALIDFNGTTDYVEIFVTNNGTTRAVEYGPTTTFFYGTFIRS